jgi:hypothetical protein
VVFQVLDELILEPAFGSALGLSHFDISDHIPLYALLLLTMGLEIRAAEARRIPLECRKFYHGVLTLVCVIFGLYVSFLAFKTGAYFHTPAETLIALVISGATLYAPVMWWHNRNGTDLSFQKLFLTDTESPPP